MSNKTYTRFVNVWFLLVMVLSVFSVTFASPTSAEAASPKKQMIKLIKQERNRVGCKTKTKGKLTRAAKRHAKDMHANNFFSETGSDGSTLSDRIKDEGYNWAQLGHILASSPGSDAQQVFNSWMGSSSREYIQDCSFKHIGVAQKGGKWTVVFGAK